MTSATALRTQDNLPGLDALARQADALRQRLAGGEKITSRELRALWADRLRPFWRLHVELYRALARRFLDHGDNYLASEVAEEGAQFFGDDVPLILTRALATARSGAPQAAQALLAQKHALLADAVEAKSLRARTFKDLWKTSGDEGALRESFALYHEDYTTTRGDRTFPGVNAASMALFLGRTDDARRIAGEVLALLAAKGGAADYWQRVTVAESRLVAGEFAAARADYAAAAADGVPPAHLATTRAQARLLLRQHGRDAAEFDECFPLPGVLAFTGHCVDAVDRPAARFPEALAPEVKEHLRAAIAGAGFGYAAAANGADILFLECMQEAGLETYVHLPLPEEEFIRQSVQQSGGAAWLERFRAVTARATEYTCATHASALAFDYGNRLLLGSARRHAEQLGSELRLLAVWDGHPGDGAGGTADYVQLAREAGCVVEIIELSGTAAAGPAGARVESGERLLSILTFSLAADAAAEQRLAALLAGSEALHREVAAARIRVFFPTPAAAALAALAIARELSAHLASALGLHTGPAPFAPHPLTGAPFARGVHAAKADTLAALEPANLIYASAPFAALLGLHPAPGVRGEFLGWRALQPGAAREPVFQLVG